MMNSRKIVLVHKNKDVFIKAVNGVDGKIEYTEDKNEAKEYVTPWAARVELEFLKFHFKETDGKMLRQMTIGGVQPWVWPST